MIDLLQQYKDINMDNELELIMSQLKDLKDRMVGNFNDVDDKLKSLQSSVIDRNEKLIVLQTEFNEHKKDDTESKKSQGERLGSLEKNPILQLPKIFGWLIGIGGGLLLALNIFKTFSDMAK